VTSSVHHDDTRLWHPQEPGLAGVRLSRVSESGVAQSLAGGGIMTIALPFGAIAIFAVGD
jgi:hypothetical protein